MSNRLNKLLDDVEEVKINLAENNVKLDHYNKLLDEHISATNDLRERVKPIEDHVKFLRWLIKAIVVIVGIPGAVNLILRLFL